MHNTLRSELGELVCEIFVIRVDCSFVPSDIKQKAWNISATLKSSFLMIVWFFCAAESFREQRATGVLLDDRAQLVITCIRLCVKPNIVIGAD